MDILRNLFVLVSQRKSDISDKLMKTFGVFGVINFPFFYSLNKIFLEKQNEFILLRLSCFILCVPLLLIDYWPISIKKYKNIYWYFSIFYCLPFFVTYMFIENFGSNMWFTKAIIGLLWLVLITDWLTFIVILSAGVLAGWVAHYLINGPDHIDMSVMAELSINYLWAALIGTAFSRKKDNITQERLIAMKTLAGTVAHEMRTPFLGIRGTAECIRKFLPALLDSYSKAKTAHLEVQSISEKNLQYLKEAPEDLDKITTSASLVIDMLLMSLKDDAYKSNNYENCSMRMCIEEAFHEYPLSEEEKFLITQGNELDFIFYGNVLLMKHILFNLLKNALYYAKAAHKDNSNISLWTESSPKGNTLYFKDTGNGMPASVVAHIFDRFYSHTRHGSGIGLAFCRSVMESFGGSIACESKEGVYTLFILKFPAIKDPGKGVDQ